MILISFDHTSKLTTCNIDSIHKNITIFYTSAGVAVFFHEWKITPIKFSSQNFSVVENVIFYTWKWEKTRDLAWVFLHLRVRKKRCRVQNFYSYGFSVFSVLLEQGYNIFWCQNCIFNFGNYVTSLCFSCETFAILQYKRSKRTIILGYTAHWAKKPKKSVT